MSAIITLLADSLVAVLLIATIVSSVGLSRRITRLKADEVAMRATIAELMLATETAERAIAGLRTTLGDCDRTLADRLRTAERYAADLASQVEAGETVMGRIAQIVDASRQVASLGHKAQSKESDEPPPSPHRERLSAAAAAAQALAERAAKRLEAMPHDRRPASDRRRESCGRGVARAEGARLFLDPAPRRPGAHRFRRERSRKTR